MSVPLRPRVDLDAVQARYEAALHPASETALGQYRPAIASAADVPDLVAELQDLREVERAARNVTAAPRMYRSEDKALVAALAALGQHTATQDPGP